MAWLHLWQVDEDGNRIPGTPSHVQPDWGPEHYEEGCWCEPTIEREGDAIIVIHRAVH